MASESNQIQKTNPLFTLGGYVRKGEVSASGQQVFLQGGREADEFYRNRWSFDKMVRSTHGVNCTGSCSWKVYVKDGVITWESQAVDYPTTGPDMPEYEPRGCPAARPFPGTPTPPPVCATPMPAVCWWICTGKPKRSTRIQF